MLTGFQLKAAIGVLKIRVTELSKLLGLNRFTIAKLEKTPNIEYLKCHTQTLLSLEDFFKDNDLLFLDTFSISLSVDKSITPIKKKLTVFQLRAARAALNLSLVQFSELTTFSISALHKLEQGSVSDYVKNDFLDTDILKRFFIGKSLSFPDDFTVRVNG
jgi:DNA-binding Xre family transcriptional regulator